MTLKAILIGVLGVIFLNGFTYFNDHVLRQPMFISHFLPISVYGAFILLVLFINPLLKKLGRRAVFTGRELAVVLTLVLTSAAIPGSSLMRTFPDFLVMPHQLMKTQPGWQEKDLMELAPDGALVELEEGREETILNGFLGGLAGKGETIGLSDVPWSAFGKPFRLWLPIILALWIGLLGLSLVVHRQWAHHEHLPYPIVRFVSVLMPGNRRHDSGAAEPGLLRNKIFWLGLAVVAAIHMNNYLGLWMDHWFQPGSWIPVKLELNLHSFRNNTFLNSIYNAQGSFIFQPRVYFTIVAFGYFLAKEVSFSLAIGPVLWVLISMLYKSNDISAVVSSEVAKSYTMGSYLAFVGTILFTGRFYYMSVLKKSAFLNVREKVPSEAVLGSRVFILSMAVLTFLISQTGIDWQLAIIFVAITVVLFLVMSRIVAETGVFFVQAGVFPVTFILAVMGYRAVGPELALALFFVSTVLTIDLREALMPFFVNNLKILDTQNVKVKSGFSLGMIAVIVGLAVAVPATLYFQYSYGHDAKDRYATNTVPGDPFRTSAKMVDELNAKGQLEESMQAKGWERFGRIKTTKPELPWAIAVGGLLVLVCAAGRLRFAGWPIHPVMFLIWATYPAQFMAWSFLIGWAVKTGVTRYGGENTYRKLQPLMFGLIGGEMLAGIVVILIGLGFFIINGEPPPIDTIQKFKISIG